MANEVRNPPVETRCINCGVIFLAHLCRLKYTHSKGLCCSRRCKYEYRRKLVIEKWNIEPCTHQVKIGFYGPLVCDKCYKSAESRRRRLEDFNISEEEYGKLANFQSQRCAICRRLPTEADKKRLAIDHAHKTGLIRGLLCRRCNVALGCLEEYMENVLDYLEKPPAVSALGHQRFTAPGQTRTIEHRKLLKKLKEKGQL